MMPKASMSKVTVKKMKVAAARRPAGGAGGSLALELASGKTSSGSVNKGSGVVKGRDGFCGESAMRLMEVYVRFISVTWIFRRLYAGCESWWGRSRLYESGRNLQGLRRTCFTDC
jgi:hypothetical protein